MQQLKIFFILLGILTLTTAITILTIEGLPGSKPEDVEPETRSDLPEKALEISSEALERLADVVQGYLEAGKIIGAELLVVKNRQTVLHRAFGWKDQEDQIPMERNTIFNIRSMTKPLTGAAIQHLIDQGDLYLDDKVEKFLPGFEGPRSRDITIEQLLTHRSGLPLGILTAIDEYDDLHSMANAAGEKGPEFSPGTKFWYSDAGSDVLGAIVEQVSGVSLREFVKQHLLDPLGMNDSFYHIPTDDPRWSRMSSVYFAIGDSWTKIWKPEGKPFYPFPWGSQSLYSTPMDYAKFLAMWMDGGVVEGRRLLSTEALARTLKPVSRMKMLGSDLPAPNGFNNMDTHYGQMSILHVDRTASEVSTPKIIGHSGSDGTWAWAWPELDLMVLYFTQSRGNTTGLAFAAEVDRLLVHPELNEANATAREAYKTYLGTYVANFGPHRNVEFTMTVQNGRLAIDVPNEFAHELEGPDEQGKWRAIFMGFQVSFVQNEQGDVTAMKIHDGTETYELPKGRALPEIPLDVETIRRYLGFYRDEEAGRTLEVIVHNGHLAIKVPEADVPLELYPPNDEGWWTMRINPAVSIRFDEDESGKIISFTARDPGGQAVRTRIDASDASG